MSKSNETEKTGEPEVPENEFRIQTGLICLCAAAAARQIAADPRQLRHALGLRGKPIGEPEILLAARQLHLKARAANTKWDRLPFLALPAIAEIGNGDYLLITRLVDSGVVVYDPLSKPAKIHTLEKTQFINLWTGRVILLKTALFKPETNHKFGLSWFFTTLSKYRTILFEIFIAAFAIQLFGLTTPLFSQVIIDKVLMHHNISTLHVLGVGMLVVIAFEGVLSVLQTHLLAHTSNRIDVILGGRLIAHMLRLPLRYFELRRVGDIVAHVRELENIRQLITGASIYSLLDLIFVLVFVAVLFLYSTALTFLVLAIVPVFVGLSWVFRPMIRSRLEERFDRGSETQNYLVEAVTGIHTIKALSIEPVMHNRWETILARYVTSSFRVAQLSGLGGAIGQMVQRASTLAILWVGARFVMNGDLTVGELVAFQMMSGRVITPVVRMAQLWQDYQQLGLSMERLGDLMNSQAEPLIQNGKTALNKINGRIAFKDVCFRYRTNGAEVLRGVNFEIKEGTTVGIVGRSGSGKSTLAKLLQRLYLPGSGNITIDGIDTNQVDPSWLRRQIGVVLQENYLFSGTIRENISIHMPNVNMASISNAAIQAGAHEFIIELPEGYDTEVGERGAALSGGQRQRIAIARALLSDPRILIFDEATSALDYESERIIQSNLKNICQGRTTVIIAHRLSTIRAANTIIVLDKGELIEQGSHHELLQMKGLYHHLFSMQDRLHDASAIA